MIFFESAEFESDYLKSFLEERLAMIKSLDLRFGKIHEGRIFGTPGNVTWDCREPGVQCQEIQKGISFRWLKSLTQEKLSGFRTFMSNVIEQKALINPLEKEGNYN